jgi:hypothetical protein
MEATDYRVHLSNASDGLSVVNRVDNTSVTAAREHHEALASEVHD